MTDEEICALMNQVRREYFSRLPKNTKEQAEQICLQAIQKMESLNFTADMRKAFVSRLIERLA
jgi:hypothetical protein